MGRLTRTCIVELPENCPVRLDRAEGFDRVRRIDPPGTNPAHASDS